MQARAHIAATVSRGYRVPQAIGLALVAALGQLFGPRRFPLPGIFPIVEVRTTVALLCALLFALALTQLASEPAPSVAATSPRGWTMMRFLRMLIAVICVVGISLATAPPGSAAVALSAVLLLSAEALIAAAIAGPGLAWSLPLAHLLAAMIFGVNAAGVPYQWAYFVDLYATRVEILTSTTVLAVALPLWARRSYENLEQHDPT